MHDCVSRRKRRRNLVAEEKNRQIPRCDTRNHPIRLLHGQVEMVSSIQTTGSLDIPTRLGEVAEQVSSNPRLEELAHGFSSRKTLNPRQLVV